MFYSSDPARDWDNYCEAGEKLAAEADAAIKAVIEDAEGALLTLDGMQKAIEEAAACGDIGCDTLAALMLGDAGGRWKALKALACDVMRGAVVCRMYQPADGMTADEVMDEWTGRDALAVRLAQQFGKCGEVQP